MVTIKRIITTEQPPKSLHPNPDSVLSLSLYLHLLFS